MSKTAEFIGGLVLFAFACAFVGVVLLVAWNLVLVPLVATCGGTVSTISYWLGAKLAWLFFTLRDLTTLDISFKEDKNAK